MSLSLKQTEYYLFARFIATPKPWRDLKTQLEFQIEHNVSHDTLARWKKDPNFWEDVGRAIKEWGREKTPDVIAAVYGRIVRQGDPQAAALWLKYIENWEGLDSKGINININQTIIQLPEERKTLIMRAFENYGLLKKPNEPADSNPSSSGGNSQRPSPAPLGG